MNSLATLIVSTVRRRLRDPLFLVLVVLPTAVVLGYETWIASDVYIAEATFVVHSEDPHAPGRLSALLAGVGLPPADETASAVEAYIKSRDALTALNHDLHYADSVSSSNVDVASRFGALPWRRGFEYLLLYYRERIEFSEGGSPNVINLAVRAYTPDDALGIARRLVDLADAKVNALDRAVRDEAVQFAEADLDEARRQSLAADTELASARASRSMYDPDRQAIVSMSIVGKLEEELNSAKALLQSLEKMAPANPQVPVLRQQIEGLESQLSQQRIGLAGSPLSMAAMAQSLDALAVEHLAAARVVASAVDSLTTARADARRRRIYLERISDPVRPDAALEPHRIRTIEATLSIGLLLWGIVRLLVSAVREHQH